MRRLPLIPTVLVLAAVAVMIALGFWQLGRLREKEAMLERYGMARTVSADARWPADAASARAVLYRHARVDCRRVKSMTTIAGKSARGEAGMAHVAECVLADGRPARIVIGWSREPRAPDWHGGEVGGIIAPGPRLVADLPVAGLEANAAPDPAEIPNNHLAYAVQWFLFAATALVIYALALWKRLAAGAAHR